MTLDGSAGRTQVLQVKTSWHCFAKRFPSTFAEQRAVALDLQGLIEIGKQLSKESDVEVVGHFWEATPVAMSQWWRVSEVHPYCHARVMTAEAFGGCQFCLEVE